MGRKPLVVLCIFALASSGCVAAGITAVTAGIVYVSGEAKKSYVATVNETHEATLKAMDEMGLVKLEETRDGDGWQIRTRRPADPTEIKASKSVEVKIRIRSGGESITEVGVRVGTWGDKDYSTKVLLAIENNLH